MRVVMTVLARDEEDIIDAQLAFHLSAGVDFVIATDNGSEDRTADIMRAYEREGVLHFISNPDRGFSQIEVVTHMARLAATDFGADWVINSDADEFWWPRGDSFHELLAELPDRYGSVRGLWRNFAPRPDRHWFFAERMTTRLCRPTPGGGAFNPHFKTLHRADPDVTVGGGNHEVFGRSAHVLRGFYPVDIFHFPVRSLEHCERRYLRQWYYQTLAGQTPAPQVAAAHEAHVTGRMEEFYAELVVGDEELAEGAKAGTYAEDTRLRDALRALRLDSPAGARQFALPPDAPLLDFRSAVDEAYVGEVALVGAADELVRLQASIGTLERRLSRLDSLAGRTRATVRSRVR